MGDVFLEQIVKKKDTTKDRILKVLIMLGGVFLCFVALLFIGSQFVGSIMMLVAVGALYFAWVFVTSLNMEFEYIFTNGEIDIDKIIAKRRRKRITTVKVSTFDEFELYNHEKYSKEQFDVRIFAGIGPLEEGTYCASYRGREGKKCLLVFNPNERILEAINVQYRRRIKR